VEAEQIRRVMLNLPPQKFEHLIKQVLEVTGFERVTVTRYSQDGGVDVNAFAGPTFWPLRNVLVQVQAKRWLHTVGRREVAELRGSLRPFARGAIVTTSHYSKSAVIEAVEPGKNPIVLLDGYEFANIVGNLKITVG
jgi:restriction endonuclease Mrr